jgi:hypothetical protein
LGDFLYWLEHSGLGRLMRGTGVWTYACVNLAHILGVSALFGSVLTLDLRLLGCWRAVPLASLSAPLVRVAGLGLALALLTGVALLATKATEYAGNPFFWKMKLPAIALGMLNLALAGRTEAWRAHRVRPLREDEERRLRWFGAASLLCWLAAMAGGRMTAYW